jgi:histidine triad (HIT) family protein
VDDCVFCGIVAGRVRASFVHRDELVSAFLDIRPVSPGHLLVVPNEHVVSVRDLAPETATRTFEVGRRLARVLGESDVVRADGVSFTIADGEAAGQDVFHAHLHVFPRFPGDGYRIGAEAWERPAPTRAELDGIAEGLRRTL